MTGSKDLKFVLLHEHVVTQEIHAVSDRIKYTASPFLIKLRPPVIIRDNDHARVEVLQIVELEERVLDFGRVLNLKEAVWH